MFGPGRANTLRLADVGERKGTHIQRGLEQNQGAIDSARGTRNPATTISNEARASHRKPHAGRTGIWAGRALGIAAGSAGEKGGQKEGQKGGQKGGQKRGQKGGQSGGQSEITKRRASALLRVRAKRRAKKGHKSRRGSAR